jgi:cation:H+ antiporter
MLISLILLIGGADKLLDSTEILAEKLGTSEFIIGLTIVAFGTSLPEIFVGIQSVSKGTENLAMGAIIGSNISNIALIFGVACIGREIYPKKNITSKRQYVPLIGSAIILGISLIDLVISPLEGLIILIVLPVFIYTIYSDRSIGVSPPDDNNKQKSTNYIWTLSILAISFVALYYGSEGVVIAGKGMGEVFGISQITIGLVVIAIGTSLPELAVTISAILKKRTDVVVGNVIGSNVLNIALVVPVIGFFGNQGSLDPFLFKRDYFVMLLITIFFAAFVFLQSKRKIFKGVGLINASGYVFVLVYILYILNLAKIL